MIKTAPHYLLFTEAKNSSPANGVGNRWRFVLEEIGTSYRFEEADEEPGVYGERLQLLAVVRGLEAIEQPSQVTLITPSKHVGRGIRRSLTLWRENDWQWERFGQMALIKDHDLWKRIDRAMGIHDINCRVWQFDPPQVRTQAPKESDQAELVTAGSNFISPVIGSSSMSGQSIRMDGVSPIENPPPANQIQSERLTLGSSRSAIQSTLKQCARVGDVVERKIRPIGQGRAYGYAVN